MITVNLPDGRTVNINTDDPEVARRTARKFLEENPQDQAPPPAMQEARPTDPQDEGLLQEIGEGIASGAISAVSGIGELGAAAIDLMADTNYASDVSNFSNELKEQMGLDPTGFAGSAAEILTQFVVPGLGAAGLVSKGTKLGKLAASGAELTKAQRFALGAQQVGAASAADMMVANDGVTTLGDFFEGGPTQTDQATGLQGREEAFRRLKNKFAIGAETGAIVTAAPVAFGAAVTGISKAADVVGDVTAPAISPIVRGIRESSAVQNTKDFLDNIETTRVLAPEQQSPLRNALADTLSIFRYRGFLPEEIGTPRSLVSGVGEAELKQASNTLNKLNSEVDKVIKGNSELTRKMVLDRLEAYLDPVSAGAAKKDLQAARAAILEDLPENVRPIAEEMRAHIDALSRDAMNSDFIKRLNTITIGEGASKTNAGQQAGDILAKTIEKNLNTYLRKQFLAKTDPNYTPTKADMQAGIEGFKNDKAATLRILKDLHKNEGMTLKELGLGTDDGVTLRLLGTGVTDKQAEIAAKAYLEKARPTRGGAKGSKTVPIEQIRTGMFLKPQKMEEYQRRLLGEVRDPEEAFLNTIADLAEFKAIDSFFGDIRQLADTNSGIGKYFRKPEEFPGGKVPKGFVRLGLTEEGLVKAVGSGEGRGKGLLNVNWGSLEGYVVPEKVYDSLTRTITRDRDVFMPALKSTYAGFLRAKGAVQYGKTVLSPITQIRNVTSAALFAASQGNVGRGANVWESVRLVLDDISKLTPENQLAELKDLQARGVIGTQAELQEIRRLINEGKAVTGRPFEEGANVGEKFGNWLATSRGGEFLGSAAKKIGGVTKKMEDLYQGGDNIWKIYNYKFEQNKLRNALAKSEDGGLAYAQSKGFSNVDDFIKAEAADIVRNNVPNYNLAPEVIKGIRKLPIGNFIAFPYEILRTGANTITRGLDELASTNKEIQKIGMRRLTGAATTFGIFPAALAEFAYETSGVSKEEMQAYQRAIAPPWEKNAQLIPTGRDENGLPTYINFSYTNPYAMLGSAVRGALNKAEEGQRLGKSSEQIAFEAVSESMSELFSPFLQESIMGARILDVMPREVIGGRGGQTVTGARVYNPVESTGDKLAKGFAHIVGGLIPSGVPVELSGRGLEAGRFARSFMEATGMNELTGVSPMDRQGRERQFAGEIVRAFTGVTENTIDPKLGLKYKGFEFARDRQSASNIFNRVARTMNVNDPEQLLEAWQDANEARYRITNQFSQSLQDLETMGMSKGEIRKILKDAGIGGVDAVLQGRYEPLQISDQVREDMMRNGTINFLPQNEIMGLQFYNMTRGFGKQDFEPRETIEQAPAEQQPAPTPAPTAPPVAPAAPAQPLSQTGNATSPIVNPNPTTRALAEELERRRG